MREEYRAELAEVTQTLVDMAEGVRDAMRQASAALLEADATGAEEVVLGDAETDARYHQVEERVYDLLARQAPVASDLRLVVTALHIGADLERMGDLACHVAKRSEEHTSELQSRGHLACRLLLEKKKEYNSAAPQRHTLMLDGERQESAAGQSILPHASH